MASCGSPFSKGQKVEVRVDEDGFRGAWFEAVVCRTMSMTRRHSVIYDSLFSDGELSVPLMEKISWDDVRPRPPRMFPPPRLRPQQEVEAYHNDGWWPGVVCDVVEAEEGGNGVVWYTVAFPTTGEVIDRFRPEWVRPRLHWDGCIWVPASSFSSPPPPPRSVQETMAMYPHEARRTPKSVEVNVGDEAPPSSLNEQLKQRTTDKPEEAWDKSNDIEYVEISSSPPHQMEMVGRRKKRGTCGPIRRRKRKNLDFPDFQRSDSKTNGTKDSKHGFLVEATSIGRDPITGMENRRGSPLPVEGGNGNHEQGDKSMGKDVHLQTDATTEDVPPYRGIGSVRQDTSIQGTPAHNNDPIAFSSIEGQSNCSPSAEHNDYNVQDGRYDTESGLRSIQTDIVNNDDVKHNICMVSELLLNKDCKMSSNNCPQFSKAAGDNMASQIPICTDMDESREKLSAIPPRKEVKLPFTKVSPVWGTIESMELYRTLPQQPHFSPLEQQPEDLREGEAIGIMLSFDSFVCSVRKLNISDPKTVCDQKLDKLHFFESHGFDVGFVKEYLKRLLQAKGDSRHKITELQKQISDHQKEMAELRGRVETTDMVLVELRKITTKFEEARASTILMLVKNESEIEKLEEKVNEASLSLC